MAEAVTRVAVEAIKAEVATAVVAATVVVVEATKVVEVATAVEATNKVMEAAATEPENILSYTCLSSYLNILLSANVDTNHFLSL